MPRLSSLLLGLLATLPASAADRIFADGFDPATWVMGYYVGYERSLLPQAEIDFGTISHLMVGRVRPLASGDITTDYDIDATNGPLFAQASVDAAHAAGRKAILMVGGAGEAAGWQGAASSANIDHFVASLLAEVDARGYDGLDLDWEMPFDTAIDGPRMKVLAQKLRALRPGLLLTIPVGWFNPNYMTPDPYWAEIAPLFDRINIMTYDMAGSVADGWTGWKSWHSSALFNTDPPTPTSPSAVDVSYRLGFLPTGVPAAKLGIGMGFYGYCWHGVTGPHQDGGTVVAADQTMSYANIVAQYPVSATRQWDATARVPYLSSAAGIGPHACTFVSYDDPQSVEEKGAYARANGIGSVIIWTIGQGHLPSQPVGQRDPLLSALRTGLGN